jgi:HEAT repeat protein
VQGGGQVSREGLINLLDLARSADWTSRSMAQEELSNIDNSKALFELFNFAQDSDDDGNRLLLLEVIEKKIDSRDIDLAAAILYCLNSFAYSENINIKTKAKELLDYFFYDPDRLQYLKVMAVRRCWKSLELNRRQVITTLIGEYKLQEVTPLILENFGSDDTELLISTVITLSQVEDTRGNPFLKELLRRDMPEVILPTIKALGNLGNFFDFIQVKEFLYHKDQEIQIEAIWSLTKIMGHFSVFFLINKFKQTGDKRIMVEIIERLGKIGNRSAIKFLSRVFSEAEDPEISLRVEWAFHDCDFDNLIPHLRKTFRRSDDLVRFKILNFFGEIFDKRCYELMCEVIDGDYPFALKASAIDSIISYDSPKTVEILKPYLLKPSEPLAYYSLVSILGHSEINNSGILSYFLELKVPIDSIMHGVVLSYIAEKRPNETSNKLLKKYLLKLSREGQSNTRYLAIRAISIIYDEELFSNLIDQLKNEEDLYIKKGLAASIIKIIVKTPDYLDLDPDILNQPDVLNGFKSEKLKEALIVKFCDVVGKFGLGYFDSFIQMNAKKLAKDLKQYIVKWSESKTIEVLLQILFYTNSELDRKVLHFLIEEVYDEVSEQVKITILFLVSRSHQIEFSEFLLRELMHFGETKRVFRAMYGEYVEHLA